MNTIAGIAVALNEALQPSFTEYAKQVLKNSKVLAKTLMDSGIKLVTNGTDNHMMVADIVTSFGYDGKEAEKVLDKIAITVNKQVIPDDKNPPLKPSGIRIGTPAATTRGMREEEMEKLGKWIYEALQSKDDEQKLASIRENVTKLCKSFKVPGIKVK